MSVFYMLDARIKLLFVLLLTILIFLVDTLPVAVCLLISFIIIRLSGKFKFAAEQNRFKLKSLKNLTLLAAIIILVQFFFGPGDSYIVKLNGISFLKQEGLLLGLVIACRLFTLMLLLSVFTESTPPQEIAAGLCALGFNYRISFIITSSFNLIPFFRDEALVIRDAQKLRGMRARGIMAYKSLLIPLMLGAMRKAHVSSVAMDSRAFGIYKTRTWTYKPKLKRHDFWFISVCLVYIACILLINYY
ncbi:MAG: energy-coupling factor transporter transmembrane protein EcfT [Treponema sp.]|nr:energy-coupling factor transporter transmembrane protein EcfT [Treponema sp.]